MLGLLSCNGYTPLDVATATIKDNRELALALEESHLEHVIQLLVATTTADRGLNSADSADSDGGSRYSTLNRSHRSSQSLSFDWSPNGGGKCLEFLQSAVWVESELLLDSIDVMFTW